MAECQQRVYAQNLQFTEQQYAHQSPVERFGETLRAGAQASPLSGVGDPTLETRPFWDGNHVGRYGRGYVQCGGSAVAI